MKAIVSREYGSADVPKFEEIEKPVPKDEEVLIRCPKSNVKCPKSVEPKKAIMVRDFGG